ncbi:unnamed protein product, partial [marine sediment metagenome]
MGIFDDRSKLEAIVKDFDTSPAAHIKSILLKSYP